MKVRKDKIVTLITLSLLVSSCTDDFHNLSPIGDAVGTTRQTSGRNGYVLDSTIAGVPSVVGSEWMYIDSLYVCPSCSWRYDTSTVRLVSVEQDSLKAITYTYTRRSRRYSNVITFNVYVHGDTLHGSGYWGDAHSGDPFLYLFPLVVGQQWRNPGHYIDTNYVARKESATVPAGTFDSFVIRNYALEPFTALTESERWYSPQVGIVRSLGSVATMETYLVWHSHLIRYHIGPRRR